MFADLSRTIHARMSLVLVSLVAVGGAVTLGLIAGRLVRSGQQNEARIERESYIRGVLDYMEGIEQGDTLPDYRFESLDREMLSLRSLVQRRSLLLFFDYYCDDCISEIQTISDRFCKDSVPSQIILISSSNPFRLQDLKKQYNITCRMLYDEQRWYGRHLNISAYPLNVVVDSDMVVKELLPVRLAGGEIERILRPK
jgi:peroxiredoxin